MPFLKVFGLAPDATDIDVEFANPVAPGKGLAWLPLKSVPVAGLLDQDPGVLVPIDDIQDAPGRLFRAAAVRVDGTGRTVSPPSPADYHNRAPYTAGALKLAVPVNPKEPCRTDLSPYLYDEDKPTAKYVLESRKEGTAANEVVIGRPGLVGTGRYEVFEWAMMEGTVLVVDASVARVQSRLTVSLRDEKGETSTLDVYVEVLAATAPPAPTGLVYVP